MAKRLIRKQALNEFGKVWAENGGVRTTGQLNFTSPALPPEPTPPPSGSTIN